MRVQRTDKPSSIQVTRDLTHVLITTPRLRLYCSLATGLWDAWWTGPESIHPAIRSASCGAKLADGTVLAAADYAQHVCGEPDVTSISDSFGKGVQVTVRHSTPGRPELLQRFQIYTDLPYFFVRLEINSSESVSTNNISPFVVDNQQTHGAGLQLSSGGTPRALFVPFDNDRFVRFSSGEPSFSDEVTAVFDNASRQGFVLGSVTHDVWKTGIDMAAFEPRTVGSMRVYGGAAGKWSQDTQPHGMVSGTRIASPRIFIGWFRDWRDGMDAYGRANAKITPPLAWKGGPPFGWNSWYTYKFEVNGDRLQAVSDFYKSHLQNAGFEDNNTVYIDLDASKMSQDQIVSAIHHIHANGQKAGGYATPFTEWGDNLSAPAPGFGGRYKVSDLILKDAAGKPLPKIDGGHPMDVTQPAALQQIDDLMHRYVSMGFDLVKLDFVNEGALEGAHYDPRITTGIQAYNLAMKRIDADLDPKKIGRPFFISLSIAPIFPGGYAHSRRIACDAAGALSNSEYTLNSLTYGWWEAGALYQFSDPDMMPLSASDAEARTRVNTSVIAGGMLFDSNDLGDPIQQARVERLLSNPRINALARLGRPFRPVEGDTGTHAADVFMRTDRADHHTDIAVFNYSSTQPSTKELTMARLGLNPDLSYSVLDLWSGQIKHATGHFSVELAPASSTILRFSTP